MYSPSKNILAAAIAFACASTAFASSAPIQPLSLDTLFSAGGTHVQNYGITTYTIGSYFSDVAVTPDDKIIAVGHAKRNSSQYEGIVVKYLSDGSVDSSFGTGGIARHTTLDDTRLTAVAIQADGKILVAGASRGTASSGVWKLVVKRLNSDGALDASFADNGIYTTQYTNPATVPSSRPSHGNLNATDIGINSKGDIFISANQYTGQTGSNGAYDRYAGHIIKLNSSGVLDTGFGFLGVTENNGKTTLAYGDIGAFNDYSTKITKLTFDANDKMYVAGQWSKDNAKTMFLSRLEADGQVFNQASRFSSIHNRWSLHTAVQSSTNTAKQVLNSVMVLPGGDIISAGCDVSASGDEVRIQRQSAGGGFVSGFGTNGIALSDLVNSRDCISDLSYHPTVGLIAVGNAGHSNPFISITNKDTGIGINTVMLPMPGDFKAVATLSSGQIVAVGTSASQSLIAVFEGNALFTTPLPTVSIPSFAEQTNIALNAVSFSTSEGVTITPSNPLNAKVIDGDAQINGVSSGSATLLVRDGDNLKLHHTSSNENETDTVTKLVIDRGAGFSHNNKSWKPTDSISTFKTTTLSAFVAPSDTTPDAFSFAAQTDVVLSAVIVSSAVSIAGIDAATAISITDGEYSLNRSSYTSAAGTLVNGDTVHVRHTSSSSQNTNTISTLTIGGVSATFNSKTAASVTTTPSDTIPDTYSFASKTSVALSTVISSNSVTITGIDAAAAISVTHGEYSLNGGSFTAAAGTLTNGTKVTVRHTSPAQYSANTTTLLSIGGVTSKFKTTTLVANTSGGSTTPPAASSGGGSGGSMNFLYLLAAGLLFSRKRK